MCSVSENFGVCGKWIVTDWNQICLAGIYKKKQAFIAHPVSFGGKTWAQIAGRSLLHVVPLVTLSVGPVSGVNFPPLASNSLVVSELNDHLASLECFLEILSDQISGILKKLSFVELVPLASSPYALSLAVSVPMASVLDSNMALDGMLTSSPFSLPGVNKLVNGFNSSSSKILTSKVGGLESKMSALEVLVSSVLMVNNSFFVVVGGDFNKDSARRYASFRKCSDLGLVNSLDGHFLRVKKTIDYVFVNEVLFSAVVGHSVVSVSEFFETNHNMVGISVGLGGLVDACLNGICKQANKVCWKYKIKDADAVVFAFGYLFGLERKRGSEWDVKDHWFCEFNSPKNKQSLKFFKLKFLVARITKSLCLDKLVKVDCLVWVWSIFDAVKASEIVVLLKNGSKLHELCSLLSKLAKYKHIRDIIDKRMESFNSNKGGMIRSVLEHSFCKVVLDHLVVDDELILDPIEIWSKTCRWKIPSALSGLWACQYVLLNHVNDNAFLGMMSNISLSELSLIISELLDGKAVGLSGITNELWKHSSAEVLACLLDLLNSCLRAGDVPDLWKKA
ncbi:hypothetical protein G9A89_009975 [Geosiphon pyriformis]|nr:hypothetical protein G9A89_009975 [Geosiphon pyriformis]